MIFLVPIAAGVGLGALAKSLATRKPAGATSSTIVAAPATPPPAAPPPPPAATPGSTQGLGGDIAQIAGLAKQAAGVAGVVSSAAAALGLTGGATAESAAAAAAAVSTTSADAAATAVAGGSAASTATGVGAAAVLGGAAIAVGFVAGLSAGLSQESYVDAQIRGSMESAAKALGLSVDDYRFWQSARAINLSAPGDPNTPAGAKALVQAYKDWSAAQAKIGGGFGAGGRAGRNLD